MSSTTLICTNNNILSFQYGDSFLIGLPVQLYKHQNFFKFEADPSIPSEPSKNQATVGGGILL
jgi:hypothetical protein